MGGCARTFVFGHCFPPITALQLNCAVTGETKFEKLNSGDRSRFCTLSSGRLLLTEHPGSHPNHRAPSFYQDVVLIVRFSITFCLTASAALTTPIPERPEGKKSYVFFDTDFAELLL